MERFELKEDRAGPLRIWTKPIPGHTYIESGDCAKGTSGDYSASIVMDAEDCSIASALHDRIQAIPFGKKLASLGWYYNEAILGIETFPAGYGTLACEAAMQAGYRNMYVRVDHRKVAATTTDDLGWKTDTITADRMIGRVSEAIRERYPIPYKDLLEELMAQRWGEPKAGSASGPKILSSLHDDLVDAYAICLCIRDEMWQRGAIKAAPKKQPVSEDAAFWADWQRRLDSRAGRLPRLGRDRR